MNSVFGKKLLDRLCDHVAPPGCCSTFVGNPNPENGSKRAVEIGFVIEHRFAFAYWLKYKRDQLKSKSGREISDQYFEPPDLVTWDWHNDVGADDDCDPKELKRLNQNNPAEVSLYAWTSLPCSNDGHILPAIWLNAIGNVYVVQKDLDDDGCEMESREYANRYGQKRNIFYFRSLREMAKCFWDTSSGTGVIWDVDLDFFITEEGGGRDGFPTVAKRSIRSMLSHSKPWMQSIMHDLRGITIALEPEFTGGLSRTLELYKTFESSLFTDSIFEQDFKWRHLSS